MDWGDDLKESLFLPPFSLSPLFFSNTYIYILENILDQVALDVDVDVAY